MWIFAFFSTTSVAQSLEELKPSYLESIPSGATLPKVEQQIIKSTNQFRLEQGLAKVKRSEKLTKTAEYFAAFMARTGKYGHEADDNRPSQRASLHGYDYCIVAENIAFFVDPGGVDASRLAQQFVTGWKESPEHRENMLNTAVTEIGVAVSQNPESKKYYAVQMFGRPKSAAIRFQLVNKSGEQLSYALQYMNAEEQKPSEFEFPPRVIRTHRLCRPATLEISFGSNTHSVEIEHGQKYLIKTSGDDAIIVEQESLAAEEP